MDTWAPGEHRTVAELQAACRAQRNCKGSESRNVASSTEILMTRDKRSERGARRREQECTNGLSSEATPTIGDILDSPHRRWAPALAFDRDDRLRCDNRIVCLIEWPLDCGRALLVVPGAMYDAAVEGGGQTPKSLAASCLERCLASEVTAHGWPPGEIDRESDERWLFHCAMQNGCTLYVRTSHFALAQMLRGRGTQSLLEHRITQSFDKYLADKALEKANRHRPPP